MAKLNEAVLQQRVETSSLQNEVASYKLYIADMQSDYQTFKLKSTLFKPRTAVLSTVRLESLSVAPTIKTHELPVKNISSICKGLVSSDSLEASGYAAHRDRWNTRHRHLIQTWCHL
ncbi:hypothetical protein RMATCC62417_01662 [Rhizopus microsporus]|nr:hypothetical protein RMATCC62417_01662 [Rhizopus microsporus]